MLADRPRCLEFRGWSLYRLGRLDEAIQTFHTSMAGAPGQISVLFDLALYLLSNGQPDEDLGEAIEAHPDIAELPATPAIRELLRRELRALGPPGSPPSGSPGGTI